MALVGRNDKGARFDLTKGGEFNYDFKFNPVINTIEPNNGIIITENKVISYHGSPIPEQSIISCSWAVSLVMA